jgi:hypothetical protein
VYYELLNKIGEGQTGSAEHCSENTTTSTKVATTLAKNGH